MLQSFAIPAFREFNNEFGILVYKSMNNVKKKSNIKVGRGQMSRIAQVVSLNIVQVKSVQQKKSYFSTKTYVVGTQKNRLNETVHLST